MSYKILIVDDSAMTRAMIKRTIRMTDTDVETFHEASDGKAALDLLAAWPVDLVLADLNMPGMDGFEMIRRIRADQKIGNLPILVLSASPSAQTFAQTERVSGCIEKPFTPELIRSAIQQALEVKHD